MAVSTYMASAHGNRQDQKEWFMTGYNEMLRRIEPEKIICYDTPFPEMRGDIVYVDYDRSSWRYLNDKRSFRQEDLSAFQIDGYSTVPYNTINAFMDVPVIKGGGSAYVGPWRPNPNKPQDQRFLGRPGETNISYTKKGELIETHIGPNGRADYEIHYTDHGNPKYHEVPHRHEVVWDALGPHLSHEEDSVKQYSGRQKMSVFVPSNSVEQNRFQSISDFKWCMNRGGEVQFDWKGVSYCCFGCICPAPGTVPRMLISQAGTAEVNARTEKWCDTPDELLEYIVGGDRLRDVITQVTVWDRTI